MTKFADNVGRQWEPEINVVTIGRVRDRLKINLLELVLPNSTLPERLGDPCLMVDVLYLLCKDQADKLEVDDLAFGKAMTPDGIEDAWTGVLEGIVSFSPRGLRPAYQKVLTKAKAFEAAQTARIKTLVEQPEFDAMLDRAMESPLNRNQNRPATLPSESSGDAGSSPALSASNQAETPSPP
jgi:hypothetical protein